MISSKQEANHVPCVDINVYPGKMVFTPASEQIRQPGKTCLMICLNTLVHTRFVEKIALPPCQSPYRHAALLCSNSMGEGKACNTPLHGPALVHVVWCEWFMLH